MVLSCVCKYFFALTVFCFICKRLVYSHWMYYKPLLHARGIHRLIILWYVCNETFGRRQWIGTPYQCQFVSCCIWTLVAFPWCTFWSSSTIAAIFYPKFVSAASYWSFEFEASECFCLWRASLLSSNELPCRTCGDRSRKGFQILNWLLCCGQAQPETEHAA